MRHLSATIALLILVGVSFGQEAKNPLQRDLEYEIMSPCCFGGPVSEHESDAAAQVKAQIGQLLDEGKTKEEIMDMYVAIYGERILARPRAQGFNLMAYIVPPLLIILGAIFWYYFMSRMTSSTLAPATASKKSYSDEFLNKIEREMKELEI